MRNQINLKFENKKHKWIYVSLDSNQFKDIVSVLTENINLGKISVKESIKLIKTFKEKRTAWVKFKSVKGRSKQHCECEIITQNNFKLKIKMSCDFILNAVILESTPKSLKLYKSSIKRSSRMKEWKIKDSFEDPVKYPSAEEELTEYGYEIYKSWQIEKKDNDFLSLQERYPLGYYIRR